MSEQRARIIASQWLVHIAELELVEALTAEAIRTLHIPNRRDTPPETMLSEEQERSAPRV